MKKIEAILSQYEKTCRKLHGCIMRRDGARRIRLMRRLNDMAREIMAFGEGGRESLFRMVEGTDMLIALNAAQALYPHDPVRCTRALEAIIRRDDGFFAYAAGILLRYRDIGNGAEPKDRPGRCIPHPPRTITDVAGSVT